MVNNVIYTVCIILITFSKSSSQDSLRTFKDYSLEQITVVSDKLDTRIIDVPTKVGIITDKQIESVNGNRLPDLLKNISSVFIKSYGLSPSLSTISINGLGAEHTLIIVDGIRLNSFQNSHIDLALIPKDNIERIEIINNGVSSVYGSDALGGVVNIVTKNRENLTGERSTKYNASISAGSFNTKEYTLGFYKRFRKFNTRFTFSRESSDGDFKYYYDNGYDKKLKKRQNSAYSLYDIVFNGQYLVDDDNVIKFFSTYSDQDKEVPGIETGTTPAPTNQIDKNWNNILSLDNRLSKNIFLKTSLNFQNNFMKYSVGSFLNSTHRNIVYSGGSEVRYKESSYGVTSGYNFIQAELESNELIGGIQRNQHAIFASTYYHPIKWIKIYPSLRYDHISDISEGTFTYKFGLNLQPFTETGLSIKGNIGKNFRAPSFNDLYWKNSGNEDLKSEKSYNVEGGIFYGFKNFLNGQFEFSYTYIHAINKIVWIPKSGTLWVPENVAESESNNYSFSFSSVKAISEEISINLSAGLQIVNTKKTSATYENDPTQNKFIPYVPLKSANINFGGVYKSLELNFFFSITGKRYSDYSNDIKMKEFNIMDGNISYKTKIFEVDTKFRFEVNNIFNTEYEIISGYPMPLRYYKITLIINY